MDTILSGRDVLVVDDEPDILEFLQYNLEKEGFTVVTASDGEAGIQKAEQENPDLIILDIMMPKMDGVEVCRVLRSRPKFAHTVIAFLTAREEDFSQIAALHHGSHRAVHSTTCSLRSLSLAVITSERTLLLLYTT